MSQACNHTTPEAIYPFDARGVAKRFRQDWSFVAKIQTGALFHAPDQFLPC